MSRLEEAREIFSKDLYATKLSGIRIEEVGENSAVCAMNAIGVSSPRGKKSAQRQTSTEVPISAWNNATATIKDVSAVLALTRSSRLPYPKVLDSSNRLDVNFPTAYAA